ncbi:IS110 family transposase, partial [bacterium]|nr:IS110 family transposase [bacterium]
MTQAAPHQSTTSVPVPALYVALELSKRTWKLGFGVDRAGPTRVRDVAARDLNRFLDEVDEAKKRFDLAPDVPVRSCYEAGRDGFWIHRFLESYGIENIVIDPASIEVNRRARRRKTDKIDVHKLVRECVRHHEGDGAVNVVRVPTEEVEDERRLPRQLKRLKGECTRVSNAIRSV